MTFASTTPIISTTSRARRVSCHCDHILVLFSCCLLSMCYGLPSPAAKHPIQNQGHFRDLEKSRVSVNDMDAIVNVSQSQPFLWWNRGALSEATSPSAPNLVINQQLQVVAELRVNSTGHPPTYVRGLNLTTGSDLWTLTSLCSLLQFIDDYGDQLHIVIGCTDHFYVVSLLSGTITQKVMLPQGTSLVSLTQLVNQNPFAPFFIVGGQGFLVLSVQQQTAATSVSGVMIFNKGTGTLTTTSLIAACPPPATVAVLVSAGGASGVTVVCSAQLVSYVSFATSAVMWTHNFTSPSALSATSFSFGASSVNVVVASMDPMQNTVVTAFSGLGSTPTPLWTTSDISINFGSPVLSINAIGETIVLGWSSTLIALNAGDGAILWNVTNLFEMQSTIISDPMIGDSTFFVYASIYVYQLDVRTGATLSSTEMYSGQVTAFYGVAAPARSYFIPMDSNTVSFTAAQWMLVISNGDYVYMWNCTSTGCNGQAQMIPVPFESVITGPLSLVQMYPSISPQEYGLLYQTMEGLCMQSLSFGWSVEAEAIFPNVLQQDGIIFANLEIDGSAVALDRNGRILWKASPPFNTFSQPMSFTSNIVLDVLGAASFAAINTYTGEVLRVISLDTSCFSNFTQSSKPSLTTFVLDAVHSQAYFASSTSCVFRVNPDLSVDTFSVGITVSMPPILDIDNGQVFLLAENNGLYALNVLSRVVSLVMESPYTITNVFPSSLWASPSQQGQRLNQIVYVATANDFTAISTINNGIVAPFTTLWTLTDFQVSAVVFYNNYLIVAEALQGVCRLQLDPSLNATSRIVWCSSTIVTGNPDLTIQSNLIVTPNGIVMGAALGFIFAADATTGFPVWGKKTTWTQISESSCSALLVDTDHDFVIVSCTSSGSFVIDPLNNGAVVFMYAYDSFDSTFTGYYGSTIFNYLGTGSSNNDQLSAYFVPPVFSTTRGRLPRPRPTSMPGNETLPPGYTPVPNAPSSSPVPSYPESTDVSSLFGLQTWANFVAFENQAGGTGVLGTSSLLPGWLFVTPICTSMVTQTCHVAAYNVTTKETFWKTEFPLNALSSGSCTDSNAYVVGHNPTDTVFVFMCNSIVYSYRASDGMALWNSSQAFPSITTTFVTIIPWNPDVPQGAPVVLAINDTIVYGLDVITGTQLFHVFLDSVAQTASNTVSATVFYPEGKNIAFLLIVGLGMQTIQLGPLRSHAVTTMSSTDDAAFCSTQSPMAVAVAGDITVEYGIYYNTDTAYLACIHGVQAHYAAVFQVSFLTSTVSSISNVTLGASSSVQGLVVDSTSSSPQLYLFLDTLMYRINTTSVTKAPLWVAAGQFSNIHGVSEDMVLVAQSTSYYLCAYEKATGYFLWNFTMQTVPQVTNPTSRVLVIQLSVDVLILGISGVYAVDVATGDVLWSVQSENTGRVRNLALMTGGGGGAPQNNNFVDANGNPFFTLQITFYGSSNVYAHVALVPSNLAAAPVTTPASIFTPFLLSGGGANANGNGGMPYGAVAIAAEVGLVTALPFGWTISWLDVVAVRVATLMLSSTSPSSTPTITAFLFFTHYVVVVNVTSGSQLGLYYYSDACSVSPYNENDNPDFFQISPSHVAWVDNACVYVLAVRDSVFGAAVVVESDTTFLSANSGDSQLSVNNQTLYVMTTQGMVFSVSLLTLSVNWVNNDMEYAILDGASKLLLPPYTSSIPTFEQIVIVVAPSGVAAVSAATGQTAWVLPLISVVNAQIATDGSLFVSTASMVMKVNMSVVSPPLTVAQRVSWSMTFSDKSSYVCSAVIPGTDVILVQADSLYALRISTGAVIWKNSKEGASGECVAVVPIAGGGGGGSSPLAQYNVFIVVAQANAQIWFFSTASGVLLYSLDSNYVSGNSIYSSQGWLSLEGDIFTSTQIVPFPTQVVPLPAAAALSVPLMPPNFAFPSLLPSSSAMAPGLLIPNTMSLWDLAAGVPQATEQSYIGAVSSEINGIDVIVVAAYVFNPLPQPSVSQMTVVDAVHGTALNIVNPYTPCISIEYFLPVDSKTVLLYCNSDATQPVSRLLFIDVSNISLPVLAAVMDPDNAYRASSELGGVTYIKDYNLVVIKVDTTEGVTAFHVNRANMATFGTIAYNVSCPASGQMPYLFAPLYDPVNELILLGCVFNTNVSEFLLVAANAATGGQQWNTTMFDSFNGYASPQAQLAMTTGYVAVFLSADQNYTVSVLSLMNGAIMTPPQTPMPDESEETFYGVYIDVITSGADPDFLVAMVTGSKTVGFSTKRNTIIWDVYYGGSYPDGAQASCTSYSDPYRNQRLTIYVAAIADENLVFYAVDALTGVILLNTTSMPSTAQLESVSILTNAVGDYGCVVQTVSEGFAYIDLVQGRFLFGMQFTDYSYSTSLFALLRPSAYASSGYALVFDFVSPSGNVRQVYGNSSHTTAYHITKALPVSLQTTSSSISSSSYSSVSPSSSSSAAELVVGMESDSTFVFSPNGTLLWGTFVDINSPFPQPFSPVALQLPTTGQEVIVRQFNIRTFGVFDLQTGSLLHLVTMPYCHGESDISGSGAMVADPATGVVYMVTGNPCLFYVNLSDPNPAETIGSVYNPHGATLTETLTITANAVIALDTYGALLAFSKISSSNPTPRLLWEYTMGYLDNDDVNIVYAPPSLLLLNRGDSLYCFMETTGAIAWRQALGPRVRYTVYNGTQVVARSWNGVYLIDANPWAPQRVVWNVSAVSLLGVPYVPPQTNGIKYHEIQPIVTANGIAVVVYAFSVIGIHITNGPHRGAIAFTYKSKSIICESLTYRPTGALNGLVFAACGTTVAISVVTGQVLFNDAGEYTSGITLIGDAASFIYKSTATALDFGDSIQFQNMPPFVLSLAPPVQVLPTQSSPPITLSPMYTPQGLPTPMPTMPPGMILPDLSCMLNIEALYNDLVPCVSQAFSTGFAGQNIDYMPCTALASGVSTCVSQWLLNVNPNCGAAVNYLQLVLAAMNASDAFNYCGQSNRCSDSTAGAQAVCAVVNAAVSVKGAITGTLLVTALPPPANHLPQFTIPSNTGVPSVVPQTTTAPATTTMAPSSPTGSSSSGLSSGQLAAAVCVPIAVLAAIVLGLLLRRRMRRNRESYSSNMLQEDGPGTYGGVNSDLAINSKREMGSVRSLHTAL